MVDGPVSNRRISRRKMRDAMVFGGAGVAILLVAVGIWFAVSKTSESLKQQNLEDMQQLAATMADAAAVKIAGYRELLREVAADSRVRDALGRADSTELAALADEFLPRFESGLKLRILPPGKFKRDSRGNPPMGFRSVGLLEDALGTKATIPVEAHFHGSPQEHLVMIEQVRGADDRVIGVLHLSLAVDMLEKMLAGVSGQSYAELQQTGAGKKLTLGKAGSASYKGGSSVKKPVPDTRWNVVYWSGSGAAAADAGGATDGFLLIGAVVVVLLLGGGGVFFWLQNRPQVSAGTAGDTQIVYAGAVEAIMQGAHPGMEKLVPNLPQMGRKTPIKPVSTGMDGEDITRIMRKDDLEQAAANEGVTPTPAQPQQQSAAAEPAPEPAAAEQSPDQAPEPAAAAPGTAGADSGTIDAGIFRAYDIRGVVGETLTAEVVEQIGRAIGSEAAARDAQVIAVGRDGRKSSPELVAALIEGLLATGRNVIDVGVVPTPLLYFATHFLETGSGVMVTGSHNGPEYNGLKIVLAGETLATDAIQGLYERIQAGEFESGNGNREDADVIADYIRRVSEDIPVALGGAMKIVVDAGNGVAGAVAPQLFRALGHDVIELFCEVDGDFPNHHPDPTVPGNLKPLIEKVTGEGADIGFAFDGDGDRLGVVDNAGNIIWPDRQLMLFARDVLSRNQGAAVVYDVKCSRHLKTIIESSGGKAVMSRTGHSLLKAKMKELEAPLAGELSGHIFFQERWYGFDDAMYAAARMLEIIMNAKAKPADVFAEMPEGVSTPEIKIKAPENKHEIIMKKLKEKLSFPGAEIIDIDGLRVEFEDGWGLIRPSNTTPCLILRFEADNDEALLRIQAEFRTLLQSVSPQLTF